MRDEPDRTIIVQIENIRVETERELGALTDDELAEYARQLQERAHLADCFAGKTSGPGHGRDMWLAHYCVKRFLLCRQLNRGHGDQPAAEGGPRVKAEPLTERESIAVCQAADDRALLRQFEMVTDEQLDEEIEGHELAIAEMDLADDASARTMRLYRLALDSLKRLRRLRALERAGSD